MMERMARGLLGIAILLLPGGFLAAQTASDRESEDEQAGVVPVAMAILDEPPAPETAAPSAEDEGRAAETPEAPEAPETTIVGRPGPFPAQPLEEGATLSATRVPTPAAEVGSSLTIIDRQQIEARQSTNVADLLRDVPALDVVQQGTPGGLASVFMRGAESRHTKVLIDGIPLNDPSNASRLYDFSYLSTDNVERIEVLRGPQSTLYGSDAVGGVISIVTKRGEGPPTARLDLMGGSFGTSREALSVSGGGTRGHFSLGASYLQSDGFSAADRRNGNTEADLTRAANFSGRMGLTPSQDWDVDYTFRYTDLDAAIDGYDFVLGRPVDQLNRQNRSKVFLNRVQTRAMTLEGFWEHIVGFSLADYDRRDTLPGPYDVPAFLGQTRKVDYQGNLAVAEWNTLSVGADYLAEDSQTSISPAQNDKGVWVQDQVRLGDQWFTTVGFRWDEYSRAGPADTYRITTLYRLPATKTTFHASLGTAFRAPALAELDYGPNLRPERSKGWDAGIGQPLGDGRLVLDCTYFRNDFTDLIQFDFTTFTLENIGRAFSSGVEFTADWQIHDCTALFGSYVYTFTEDLTTGLPLLRRAPHKGRFGIRRRMLEGRGQVLLDCLYVGPREDVGQYPDRTTLSEYWLVNLAGTYDVTQRLQVLARLDNLLDEKYQEVYGYGAAGLSFFGGGNVRW